MNMYHFGTQSKEVLDTVSDYLVLTAELTISHSKMDISVPEWGGLRTAKYQNKLFNKEWSKADGYNKLSKHQLKDKDGKSLALDLCGYYKGEQTWNKGRLGYIAALMHTYFHYLKEVGRIPDNLHLHCGAFWTPSENDNDGIGWDAAHYELRSTPQIVRI